MRLVGGAETSTGQVRSENQDRPLLTEWLAGVADGMGGHRAGERAAHLAVTQLSLLRGPLDADELVAAVQHANDRILQQAEDPAMRGMGTTLVLLTLAGDQVVVANVGDSRAYRLVGGALEQLTEDHSLVEDLVRQGQLTADEARSHPQRNIVTRALGISRHVDVDLFRLPAEVGDRYLLCSDGLFNEVEVERIAAELRRWEDPGEAARELVRLANEAGARDNVTCVVVDVGPDDGTPTAAAAGDLPASDGRPDAAGFEAPRSRPPRAVPAQGSASGRTGVPWRAVPFVVAVLVIAGVAVGGTIWWDRSAYFVDVVGGEVVILQGRPDGVLWMDPEVVERTGIAVADLTGASQQRLVDPPVGSLDQARRLVEGLEVDDAAPAGDDAEAAPGSRPSVTTTTEATVTTATTSAP